MDLRAIRPPDELGRSRRLLLTPLLAPLAAGYAIAIRAWRSWHVRASDPGLPILSIGSISVGGTGKTPLAIEVARRFAARGVRVGIVSRGYRRKSTKSPLAVSDGRRLLVGVEEAGDEPYMMAKRLPDVGVVVGRNRFRAALVARDLFDPGLLILDDGFQYKRIAKSAEIVCLDRRCLKAGTPLLPLGPLREGLGALRPDHIAVITLGLGEDPPPPEDLARLGVHNIFFFKRSTPTFTGSNGKAVGIDLLTSSRVAVVSGIARPADFEASCLAAGLDVAVSVRFEDHHWYVTKDVDTIRSVMERTGCSRLVTTEKDMVKLPAELRHVAVVARADPELSEPDRFFSVLEGAVGVG
jgi:tetraacyldisaccharide 4'-kinase